MNIRYNNFIETSWDKILYNAKAMNFAKNKQFLRKLIYSGRVMTSQTFIPKFNVGEIGTHNGRNNFRHLYFKRLCDYIDVYQTKFGDGWDIHFQKSDVLGEKGYLIYLFKVFDKVTVTKYDNTDSIITSHNIRDLAVFNTVGMKEDRTFWIPRMKGLRLSFISKEVASGYKHSHLSPSASIRESPDYLQDFCIGSYSDTSMLSGLLATQFSKEQFELYLYAQDSTIECESSIGTPHIRFSTIFEKAKKTLSIGTDSIASFYRNTITPFILENPIDVNYYISNNNYSIKKDDVFHSFIKNSLLQLGDEYWKQYLCKKGENDNYYSYEILEQNTVQETTRPLSLDGQTRTPPYIYYRGEKREFKILKEQPTIKTDELKIEEFIVYPPLLNYIHGKLEHNLQKAAIARSNVKRYYSRNNVASYIR